MVERIVLGLTTDIILIGQEKKKITARVDTGATKSSIDQRLAKEMDLGKPKRTTTIKQAHGSSERPIIKCRINIAGLEMEPEFTLADRSHMKYKMLIGQNTLKKGNFLIDPNK